MAEIIAIINDKGGVAKTTTTANLGTALWLLGKKVLLVDTDQQCNLTQIMDLGSLMAHDDGKSRTLFEWLLDITRIPIYERYEGLDFIPSSRKMSDIEERLGGIKDKKHLLEQRLDLLRKEYDYILIDCTPGGKNLINSNVLVASDSVIVPIEASFFSVQGTPNLLHFINEIRQDYKKALPVLGYLLVKYNERTRLGREVQQYYSGNSNIESMLFKTSIRVCQRCNESPGQEMTLFEYSPECSAAADYMRLAQELSGIKKDSRWNSKKWSKIIEGVRNRQR